MRTTITLRRALLALGIAGVALTGAAAAGSAPLSDLPATCPPGYHPIGSDRAPVTGRGALADALAGMTTAADGCVNDKAPESAAEIGLVSRELQARRTAPFDTLRPGAYAAAVKQRAAVARTSAAIPGTGGTWTPLGKTPLNNGVEGYDSVNGLGLRDVAGRVQGFAYDKDTKTLYTAVAQGGLYKSMDLGETWTSIGDRLPTQMVASVAFSTANGGTLFVVTGDSAPGGNSFSGLGVFTSTDEGKTWVKGAGVPDGYLGFTAAVDPTNPKVMYAATGAGLWRSADAGKTFTDVKLPTGECAGIYVYPCGLATMVTDVVVQGADNFGNTGGRVVAAVGWRAGRKAYADSGKPQAAWNGIYVSDTGLPDSFTYVTGPPAQQERIGRIELGAATGLTQNHDFLYAIVQDAVKFNDGAPGIDIEPAEGQVPNTTVLEGVYVSPDFGDTWVQIKQGDAMSGQACASGSALCGANYASLYAPGVQAWYNMWIQPDPSRADPVLGAPTRLLLGLEEVFESRTTTTVPVVGPTEFKVIGRYFAGSGCFFLSLDFPVCPTNGLDQGGTTTHPDQHGALFIEGPDEGAVTLLVGNDGGTYKQSVAAGQEFSQGAWGNGHVIGQHTLLPYDAKMAKDGVVWAGLQDNGHMRINPDGTQIATFGGDGTFAAVDPDASEIAYEATPAGSMNATSDGGKSWNSIDPLLINPAFVTPFVMDPRDAEHLITAGRDVKETVSPQAGDWVKVFDLGTAENPGVEPQGAIPDPGLPVGLPVGGPEGIMNRMSAIDLDDANAYVGFCGYCDVLTQSIPFKNGMATNVGGDAPPEIGTESGWHIAAAKGLPNRIVTGIAIDPKNPRTVYVTLGGYSRRWAPPDFVVENPENVGVGHVFKSTDAAESFTDISGNLPDITANWVELRGDQILVATDFGVFSSPDSKGMTWGLLGGEYGLPMAPVFTMHIAPQDPNLLVAATYGRGVYTYRFDDRVAPPVVDKPKPPVAGKPPVKRPIPSTGGLPLAGLGLLVTAAAALAVRRQRAAA